MFRTIKTVLLLVTFASAQPTPPTIASITSTTDAGSYILGAEINITVNFSELVTLTDAQLEIVLETGETDRSVFIAAFATAATSASASYKVRQGDETAALSVNSITMGATGGSALTARPTSLATSSTVGRLPPRQRLLTPSQQFRKSPPQSPLSPTTRPTTTG